MPMNVIFAGAALLLAVFASSCATSEPSGAEEPPLGANISDPDEFVTGELNEAGVETVRKFTSFPTLWLGESFQGFPLTRVQVNRQQVPPRAQGVEAFTTGQSVMLIYGDCTAVREPDEEHASCTYPVVIFVNSAGLIPNPDAIADEVYKSDIREERGVQAREVGAGKTVLWLPGVTITVHGNLDLREAAIEELRTANHDVLGIPAVLPEAPLTDLEPTGTQQ